MSICWWAGAERRASTTEGAWRLQAGQKGVLVRRIEPTLPANKQLRKGDILLSFDGTQIGNDGTVAFRSGERIGFSYLISNKQNDEDVRP